MQSYGLFIAILFCSAYSIYITYGKSILICHECSIVRCNNGNCDGVWIDNATACGCCPGCKEYLEEGDNCTKAKICISHDAYILLDGGRKMVDMHKVEPICRPPLECIKGKCTKPRC